MRSSDSRAVISYPYAGMLEGERLRQAREHERLRGAVRADEQQRRFGGKRRDDDRLEVLPTDDAER